MAKLILLSTFLYLVTIAVSDDISSNLLPGFDICGLSVGERIVGGELTGIREFPWMALLQYRIPSGKDFKCGGALINNRYVLTAAHCLKRTPPTWTLIKVRLGEHTINKEKDCEDETPGFEDCAPPPVDIGIEEAIAHEQYVANDPKQYHDIALLRLKEEVKISEFIKPICLPITSELRSKTFDNVDTVVAGWGRTENSSKSNIKLKLKLPVTPQNECESIYSERSHLTLIKSQMCAGGHKGQDSCSGDSGGPLMLRSTADSKDNWVGIGIVSFGPTDCGLENWPGVYTRVTDYIPWIIEHMKP